VLAVLLLLLVPAAGPRAAGPAEPLAAPQRACLWAVAGPSGRVYLLGSIHFLRKDDYPLPAAIEAAYTASRAVAFETDIERLQDPAVQSRMLELGTYPPGQSLFAALGADTRGRLERKLAAAGVPPQGVAGLRPWMVALTLATLELQRLGFDPGLGVDMHFHRRAKADGKRRVGLETAEQQLQVFAALDAAGQEALLAETLQDLERLPRMTADVLSLWSAGDAAGLQRLLFATIDQYPSIRERVLTARNRAWLPKIEELLRAGEPALVVVGAMHLIGPGSVIELLRQKGYSVAQQ
jgi:hypothetical protein